MPSDTFLSYTFSVLDEASDEKRLAQTLLRNYKLLGKIGRPVKNSSHPLHLKFGMGLISMNVEEKENMLSLSVWTKLVRVILMIQFNTLSIVQLCVIAIGKASDVANK